jgi:hypothetical protein
VKPQRFALRFAVLVALLPITHPSPEADGSKHTTCAAGKMRAVSMGSLTPSIKKVLLMSLISADRRRGALAFLVLFHIVIIIASNYLVQLPITLFGWHTTWGAFSFPFIFLATDLRRAW